MKNSWLGFSMCIKLIYDGSVATESFHSAGVSHFGCKKKNQYYELFTTPVVASWCCRLQRRAAQQRPGQSSPTGGPAPISTLNDKSILERRLRQNRHVSYLASWGTGEERKNKSSQAPTAGDWGMFHHPGFTTIARIFEHKEDFLYFYFYFFGVFFFFLSPLVGFQKHWNWSKLSSGQLLAHMIQRPFYLSGWRLKVKK